MYNFNEFRRAGFNDEILYMRCFELSVTVKRYQTCQSKRNNVCHRRALFCIFPRDVAIIS